MLAVALASVALAAPGITLDAATAFVKAPVEAAKVRLQTHSPIRNVRAQAIGTAYGCAQPGPGVQVAYCYVRFEIQWYTLADQPLSISSCYGYFILKRTAAGQLVVARTIPPRC